MAKKKKYSDGGGLNVDMSNALDFQDTSKMSSNSFQPKLNLNSIMSAVNQGAPFVNIAAQAVNWGLDGLRKSEYDVPKLTKDTNPYMSHGGSLKKYTLGGKMQDPIYNVLKKAPRKGVRKNSDGSESTHLMTYTESDKKYYAYPTLFQNEKDEWIELNDKDNWAAFEEAKKRGELFEFDSKEKASEFAKGSWKQNLNLQKMSHGGTMPGSKSFDGPSHEQGGIPVDKNGQQSSNPIAEVEGDEFMHKFSFIPNKGNYIFSKKLGTADMAESIVDKYTKMKGHKNPIKDSLVKTAMEFELKNVADLNEMRKAIEEQAAQAEQASNQQVEQGVMKLGGILGKIGVSKYANGGGPLQTDINEELFSVPDIATAALVRSQNKPLGTLPMNRQNPLSFEVPKSLTDMQDKTLADAFTDNSSNSVVTTKVPGVSDALRTATMIGDAFQAMRPAEKESPILTDYSKMRGHLDSLSADLTPAKNAVAGAFNEGNQQIRDGSTSLQGYMARRMGSTAQQAEALSQIAGKERELRNSISQTKAAAEGQMATDDANRKYQNRIDNLQNKAAKEAYLQRLGDNMLGIAKALDEKQIAALTIQEGNSMLKAMSDNFEIISRDDGSKEITFKTSLKSTKTD